MGNIHIRIHSPHHDVAIGGGISPSLLHASTMPSTATDDSILSDSDQLRAVLSNQVAYSLNNPDLGATSEERFHTAVEHLHDTHPELASHLDQFEVLQSNQDAIFLHDTGTNVCYGVMRGTDVQLDHGSTLRDLLNDAQIGLTGMSHRADTVQAQFEELRAAHPECTQWEFTGHSLGGSIAIDLGTRNPDVQVHAFEPWHVHDPATIDALPTYDNIVEHCVNGDIVCAGPSVAGTVHRYDVPTQPDESFVDRLLHMHSIDNFTNPASGISLGSEDGLPLGPLVPPDMVQVLGDPSLLERLPDFGDTNWDEQIPWHSEEVVHHPPLFGDDVGANLAATPHDGGDLFGEDQTPNDFGGDHTFSSCGGGDGLEFGNSGFENSFSGHVFDDFGSNAQLCGGEDAW